MAQTSDAQLRANAKYDAENTTGVYLKLNNIHDADIIARLESTGNMQGYIKKLVRSDIENG